MRLGALLLLLGACGGVTSSVSVTAAATASTDVTANLAVDHLGPAPADVDTHLHESPTYVADLDKLYIEITSEGDHAEVLRRSVNAGLGAVPYAASVEDGGDLELHAQLASLTPGTDGTSCKVKLFVMRLPQHDLLAIADGSGRTTGNTPADACVSTTGTAIVQQKLPPFLQRQLDAKQ